MTVNLKSWLVKQFIAEWFDIKYIIAMYQLFWWKKHMLLFTIVFNGKLMSLENLCIALSWCTCNKVASLQHDNGQTIFHMACPE